MLMVHHIKSFILNDLKKHVGFVHPAVGGFSSVTVISQHSGVASLRRFFGMNVIITGSLFGFLSMS